jgi:hypothetical protein
MQAPIFLICAYCAKSFEYPAKEYKRQSTKYDRSDDTYCCSRSCVACLRHNRIDDNFKARKENLVVNNIGNKYGRKYSDEDKPFAEFMRRARMRSSYKKYDRDDMDIDYLKSIWKEQKGLCAITRVIIYLEGNISPFKASLDRKDSSIGYVRGNVQFVAYSVNLAKQSFPDEEILEFFLKVVDSLTKDVY